MINTAEEQMKRVSNLEDLLNSQNFKECFNEAICGSLVPFNDGRHINIYVDLSPQKPEFRRAVMVEYEAGSNEVIDCALESLNTENRTFDDSNSLALAVSFVFYDPNTEDIDEIMREEIHDFYLQKYTLKGALGMCVYIPWDQESQVGVYKEITRIKEESEAKELALNSDEAEEEEPSVLNDEERLYSAQGMHVFDPHPEEDLISDEFSTRYNVALALGYLSKRIPVKLYQYDSESKLIQARAELELAGERLIGWWEYSSYLKKRLLEPDLSKFNLTVFDKKIELLEQEW